MAIESQFLQQGLKRISLRGEPSRSRSVSHAQQFLEGQSSDMGGIEPRISAVH